MQVFQDRIEFSRSVIQPRAPSSAETNVPSCITASTDRKVLPCRTAAAPLVKNKMPIQFPGRSHSGSPSHVLRDRLRSQLSLRSGITRGDIPPRENARWNLTVAPSSSGGTTGTGCAARNNERPYPDICVCVCNKSRSKYLKHAVEVSLNGMLRSIG